MRIFVSLKWDEFEQLREQATLARRRPQDQAAVLITRALQSEACPKLPGAVIVSRTVGAEGGPQ